MTTDSELLGQGARLDDRAEIRECMTRYARGMDRQRSRPTSVGVPRRRDRRPRRIRRRGRRLHRLGVRVSLHPDAISALPAQPHRRRRRRRGARRDVLPLRRDRPRARQPHDALGRPLRGPTRATGRRWAIVARVCVVEWNHGVDVIHHRRGDRDDGRLHEGGHA